MRSLLLSLFACLLLAGCAGGPKTYVFPPQAQIQQLEPGSDGQWRIALFQNTPAQFHGRPEAAEALTDELRAAFKSRM